MRMYQGVDIVEVSKLKEIMSRNKDFIQDVFTEAEKDYCLSFRDASVRFAGRFAAKEACLKALGTGFSGFGIDYDLREIEVLPGRGGNPFLTISGWTEKISKKKKITQLTVSISHTSNYCVSTVLLVGNP